MNVGVMLPIFGEWPKVLELATFADRAGADSVWVPDHMVGLPPDMSILEAWTIMSAVGSVTERVEIGTQVLCQSFRNPALLAKMVATLDNVTYGRVRLLIGTGWMEAEYDAYGWEFPPPGPASSS